MTGLRNKLFAALAALAFVTGGAAIAQQTSASVHGHVTDPAGIAVTKGEIKFTQDMSAEPAAAKYIKTVSLDASGNYTATDVAPGRYYLYVYQDDKTADRMDVTFKPGDNLTVDFDMTREAYMKDLSPERKKEIEEYKKKYAAVSEANKVINNLNNTLKTVRADMAAAAPTKGDVSAAVKNMKDATDAKPEEGVLWIVYGDTLQAQGDHLAAEDKKAGTSVMSDDAVIKTYTDAVSAYQKGIDLNVASKKPAPADQAVAFNSMGNTEAKLGKGADAAGFFDKAVALDPTKAGMFYNNEAAVLFNALQAGNSTLAAPALAAAEKAIAADPNRADPYYIKGQVLIRDATVDKAGAYVLPPGTADAYQHFLSLAPPDSARAAEVKQLLAGLGVKVDTKYVAPRTKK